MSYEILQRVVKLPARVPDVRAGARRSRSCSFRRTEDRSSRRPRRATCARASSCPPVARLRARRPTGGDHSLPDPTRPAVACNHFRVLHLVSPNVNHIALLGRPPGAAPGGSGAVIPPMNRSTRRAAPSAIDRRNPDGSRRRDQPPKPTTFITASVTTGTRKTARKPIRRPYLIMRVMGMRPEA